MTLTMGMSTFAALVSCTATAASPLEMPADLPGDRVVGGAGFDSGQTLRFYTDTGGGNSGVLSEAAAKMLGLHPATPTNPAMAEELGSVKIVEPPPFAGTSPLPARDPAIPWMIVLPRVAPPGWTDDSDGLLGNSWFAGHIWTWDYPGQKLLLQPRTWQPAANEHVVPLGFRINEDGARASNFPRITIEIDGRPLSMLLDTGAETQLMPTASKAVGDDGPMLRATSMIAATIFRDWRARHPDWRYVPAAQLTTKSDMIKVPEVRIAGYVVGPVWFTERPDTNFHDMMSSMMDAQVEGAVGGNVFHSFRMTVDYPNARAAFRCVRGCRDVAKLAAP